MTDYDNNIRIILYLNKDFGSSSSVEDKNKIHSLEEKINGLAKQEDELWKKTKGIWNSLIDPQLDKKMFD